MDRETYYQATQPVLDAFLKNLREANKLYRDSENGGREGVILALKSVVDLCDQFHETRDESLSIPLIALASALQDLEKGTVAALLKKEKSMQGGKQKESEVRQMLRAAASAGMEMLITIGLGKKEAAKRIASLLNKAKISNNGCRNYINPITVIKWHERTGSEPGSKASEIKRTFMGICSPTKDTPQESAIHMILSGIEIIITKFSVADK